MAGARAEARRNLVRRLFRSRNRRARVPGRGAGKGWRPSGATIARAAAGVLLLAGTVVAWPTVRAAVRTHPYFAVREVVVADHGHLSAETIRALAGERGIAVETADERFSTVVATRAMRSAQPRRGGRRGAREHVDAAAAAVILQSWLEASR